MKTLSFIAYLLTAQVSIGQTKLALGNIVSDSGFNTSKQLSFNYYQSETHQDSVNFGLSKITYSRNELEIRLRSYNLLQGTYSLISLYYFNGQWGAKKYLHEKSGPIIRDSESALKPEFNEEFLYNRIFHQILDTLKTNNVFLLPKINLDKYSSQVKDGVVFTITFKVEKDFRSYRFSNPETLKALYPDIEDFRNFSRIVRELFSLFN